MMAAASMPHSLRPPGRIPAPSRSHPPAKPRMPPTAVKTARGARPHITVGAISIKSPPATRAGQWGARTNIGIALWNLLQLTRDAAGDAGAPDEAKLKVARTLCPVRQKRDLAPVDILG